MSQAFDLSRFLDTFVAEARERLDRFEQGIIALEASPSDEHVIRELLREAHTIKGSARMVGLERVDLLAHRTESVLGAVRDQLRAVDGQVIDCLLAATDGLRTLVDEAAGDKPAGSCDLDQLVAQLAHLLEASPAREEAPRAGRARPAAKQPAAKRKEPEPARRQGEPMVRVNLRKLEQLSNLTLDLSTHREQEKDLVSHLSQYLAELRRAERTLHYLSGRMANLCQALHQVSPACFEEAGEVRRAVELVLAELRSVTERAGTSLQGRANLRRRDLMLAEELRNLVAELHLVPISTIFDAFPRAVRDIGAECGKDVQLRIEGGDTQLDKKIVEELGEPLLHLVWNAIGHGIEATQERLQAGKPPRGTICLEAQPVGDRIQVRVSDDGAGLDLAALRTKAVERGLVSADEALLLPEQQVRNLIFSPGLSTARMITDVAGRGVGMDIVESTVRRLNGTISMESEPGWGTTFIMDLPLTVVVMNVLLVQVSDGVFAVPTSFVRHVAGIRAEQLELTQGGRVLRLEETPVTVVELGDLIGLPSVGWNGRSRPVLVAGTRGEAVGFAVDEVLDEDRVVVKSLASCPVRLRLVMAATIGPAGRVVPILDVAGLVEASRTPVVPPAGKPAAPSRVRRVLVVDDSAVTGDLERNILEGAGYQVQVANDGMEALLMLSREPFDLVVSDVEMPRLDGFALLERLRADPQTKAVPVVMVTSRHRAEDKQRGLDLGADAYLLKATFDQSHLLDTVQRLIG